MSNIIKTIMLLLLVSLASIVLWEANRPDALEDTRIDTVYTAMPPDTVYTPADITYVIKVDTQIVVDTLLDTVFLDKVASMDTVMQDSARIGVRYSYFDEQFMLSYNAPEKRIITKTKTIYKTRNPKWYERFGAGIGVGTDFSSVRFELQVGYYFRISDLMK